MKALYDFIIRMMPYITAAGLIYWFSPSKTEFISLIKSFKVSW